MIFEAFLFFVFCSLSSSSQENNSFVPFHCVEEHVPADSLLAYQGWPFRITCNTASKLDALYEWNIYDEPIQCVIVDESGKTVFNRTTSFEVLTYDDEDDLSFLTPDVYQNSSLNYTLLIVDYEKSRCLKIDFRINVTKLPELTCQNVADFARRKTDDDTAQRKSLICNVAIDDYPKIEAVEEVTYNWYHNCSDLPNGTKIDTSDPKEPKLRIPSVGFEHAGYFICSATYKGMTRFVIQHNLCIRHALSDNDLILDCNTDVVRANPGESAELKCTATFGQGNLRSSKILIVLKKSNSTTSQQKCTDKYSARGNIGCSYDNPTDQCFFYTPSAEELKVPTAAVEVSIVFNNIEEKDYGQYQLFSQLRFTTKNKVNVTFTLEPNLVPQLLSQAVIAGICIGASLVFIVIMLIMIYNAVYIRVYWKRHFGVYILDDKRYGALLTYNFSNIELDKFAREQVQSSIPKIRKFLESLGYRVYDDHQDHYLTQGRAENIETTIEESHRIIVFLSSDFIKDGWSMLTLHKGFHEMINSRSKLIFILLPGVKEYLKQHSKDDDSCRLIQRAIKLNYAIEFPKNFNSTRFRYEIKDAMPKLRYSCSSNISSISSQSDLSLPTGKTYQRCFSNETDITVVDGNTGTQGEVLQIIEELNHGTFDNAL